MVKKKLIAAGLAGVMSLTMTMTVAAAPFDAAYYAEKNPDVVAVVGNDPVMLEMHYNAFGQTEGRAANLGDALVKASSGFDAAYYAAQNPELVAIIGNDPAALLTHYLTFGQTEGRAANAAEAVSKSSASGKSGADNETNPYARFVSSTSSTSKKKSSSSSKEASERSDEKEPDDSGEKEPDNGEGELTAAEQELNAFKTSWATLLEMEAIDEAAIYGQYKKERIQSFLQEYDRLDASVKGEIASERIAAIRELYEAWPEILSVSINTVKDRLDGTEALHYIADIEVNGNPDYSCSWSADDATAPYLALSPEGKGEIVKIDIANARPEDNDIEGTITLEVRFGEQCLTAERWIYLVAHKPDI